MASPHAGPARGSGASRWVAAGALLVLLSLLPACAHRGRAPAEPDRGDTERGIASWYGEPYHGRQTASGEVYDMHELTAAHRTLPFGTVVRVTRRDTGARVEVRVNDRGPFIEGRIIDLSYAAAREIGLDTDGVAPVKIVVVDVRKAPKPKRRDAPNDDEECVWVQVGAFGDVDNARRARDRLEASGEHAVLVEGPGGLQRVRVGPFDDGDEAEAVRRRLSSDWPSAQLVQCGG
jgi:rare lipoprotein A